MRTITITLLALTLCFTAAFAGEKIDRTLKANADGKVEISNIAGSITVTGWDRDEVKVTGTLGDGTEGLEFESSGNKTIVEVKYPDHARNVEDSFIDVWVPAGSDIDVGAVSASIDVNKVKCCVELQSVSGDIKLNGEPGSVDVEAVSGNITIDVKTKRVTAETVSGSINIKGVEEEVEASTVSGSIDISGKDLKKIEAEAVSGTVSYEGGLAKGARVNVSSFSGTVNLYLPASLSADIDVSTFSGSIHNEFGGDARRTSKYAPGKELEFTVGSGDASISCESFSGTVNLKKK